MAGYGYKKKTDVALGQRQAAATAIRAAYSGIKILVQDYTHAGQSTAEPPPGYNIGGDAQTMYEKQKPAVAAAAATAVAQTINPKFEDWRAAWERLEM